MNKVKYQVFVSSTYDDLKEERDQVIKAILEMGHIPVGMEMFSAADEEQWQIITRQIDDSDYYIVIVANRYGSMVKGLSYTEKEYNYALKKGVPTLGFVLDKKAPWPSDRSETDSEASAKLEAFKKKVKKKPVNFWTSKEDLHGKCAVALSKTFNTQPRPGWLRSSDTVGPEVAAELSRLSSENARLREENAELKKGEDTSDFAQGEDSVVLHFTSYLTGNEKISISTTWNRVFSLTAESILENSREDMVYKKLGRSFTKAVYDKIPLAQQTVSYEQFWRTASPNLVNSENIRNQLFALSFVEVMSNNGPVADWKLTERGKRAFSLMVAKRRE